MIFHLFKRFIGTTKKDIGEVFIDKNVQKLLLDITRFEEKQIFAPRPVRNKRTPRLMFMTDKQLEQAKRTAYDNVKARLQMPPVMSADRSEPQILSKDEDLVGYTRFKIMFIDISPARSNTTRLMSVRETDGTLRYPTHEERSRLNHIFYPDDTKSIDPPKMFEREHMDTLLKNRDYKYILDRACIQFEPNDPRFVDITAQVYDYIDTHGDYDKLRSTRHFGPMCLYLVYHKRADSLAAEMNRRNYVEDAKKLQDIYDICHQT